MTVPVTGKVTFHGGPMPAKGMMFFTVLEPAEGFPARPGVADFEVDGRFSVKTWEHGDGLMPGRYGVSIHCWEVPPNMDGRPVKSHLPDKYFAAITSDLEVVIEPGARAKVVNFDIPTEE